MESIGEIKTIEIREMVCMSEIGSELARERWGDNHLKLLPGVKL